MPAIIGLMALLGAVFGSLEVTTVAYAEEQGAPQAAGWVLALYAAGSLVGGLLMGALRPTGLVTRQLLLASALLALVSAPLPLVSGLGWLSLLALGAGLAVAPVLILATSLVELLVPAARITEALTLTSSGIAVGLAIAAPLAGAIIDRNDASSGYLIMAGAALGALILMLLTRRGLLRRELAATPGG